MNSYKAGHEQFELSLLGVTHLGLFHLAQSQHKGVQLLGCIGGREARLLDES